MNKSTNLNELHGTIETIDSLSQEGFSQIAAIASLALTAMQTPAGCNDLEAIAFALRAIECKAEGIENCINSEAEQVGCSFKDVDTELRYNAYRIHREQQQGEQS